LGELFVRESSLSCRTSPYSFIFTSDWPPMPSPHRRDPFSSSCRILSLSRPADDYSLLSGDSPRCPCLYAYTLMFFRLPLSQTFRSGHGFEASSAMFLPTISFIHRLGQPVPPHRLLSKTTFHRPASPPPLYSSKNPGDLHDPLFFPPLPMLESTFTLLSSRPSAL